MATHTRARVAKRAAKKDAPRKRPLRNMAAKKAGARTAAKKTHAKATAPRRPAKRTPSKRAASKAPRAKAARPTPAAPDAATNRRAAPKRAAPARRAPGRPAIDPAQFPCGEDAIRAATGKGWGEWVALLDASGAAARKLDHQRIWDLAMQSLPDTAGWWGQMVSVGYERARGLREKHESSSGAFQSTTSKTFPVPLFAAFAAFADASLRGQWLDAPELSFTKLNAGRNIRARWPDGSLLDIRFAATGPDKCQVVVDSMKLADGDAVRKAKAFWQAQFERLSHYLAA